eukprot:Skav227350  [mRNA]  locus=scaffold1665:115040:115333:+ [translate_table: standard]
MANVSPHLGGIQAVKPAQLDESDEESKLIAAIPKAPSKLFGNEDINEDFLVSDAFELMLAQVREQHVIDMTETLGEMSILSSEIRVFSGFASQNQLS